MLKFSCFISLIKYRHKKNWQIVTWRLFIFVNISRTKVKQENFRALLINSYWLVLHTEYWRHLMLQSLELEAQKVHPGDVQSSQENTCDGDFFKKLIKETKEPKSLTKEIAFFINYHFLFKYIFKENNIAKLICCFSSYSKLIDSRLFLFSNKFYHRFTTNF